MAPAKSLDISKGFDNCHIKILQEAQMPYIEKVCKDVTF